MTRYFTSDIHFGHFNVITYCSRPYTTVEDMNIDLIAKWNETVTNEDEVYVLGDLSLSFDILADIVPLLNGKKFLVPGNHDHCHSYHKRSRKSGHKELRIAAYTELGFTVLDENTTINIKGTEFNVCHFPYTPDSLTFPDKYATYRLKDYGMPLLCGHVHEKWHTKKTEMGTIMINVGVDVNNYKPVSEDQLWVIYNTVE